MHIYAHINKPTVRRTFRKGLIYLTSPNIA